LAAEEDIGKAGPVGLFLILSLLIVVFFLGRSMRTHLRRVPLEFPEQATKPPAGSGPVPPDDRPIEGEILERLGDRPHGSDDGDHRPGKPQP